MKPLLVKLHHLVQLSFHNQELETENSETLPVILGKMKSLQQQNFSSQFRVLMFQCRNVAGKIPLSMHHVPRTFPTQNHSLIFENQPQNQNSKHLIFKFSNYRSQISRYFNYLQESYYRVEVLNRTEFFYLLRFVAYTFSYDIVNQSMLNQVVPQQIQRSQSNLILCLSYLANRG